MLQPLRAEPEPAMLEPELAMVELAAQEPGPAAERPLLRQRLRRTLSHRRLRVSEWNYPLLRRRLLWTLSHRQSQVRGSRRLR